MSFKSSIVKMALKLTPNIIVLWVANHILKGIAELSDFNFDLGTRTASVQATLNGEAEAIEIQIDGFAIVSNEESHHLIIDHARSNRPWLNNLLARITGKAWKIPAIPQYQEHIELISELFKPESGESEEQDLNSN